MLKDKSMQKVFEPITEKNKKQAKEFEVSNGFFVKEYLYIVTDYLPFTISDLGV